MFEETDEDLLKKYPMFITGDNSQRGSALCSILRRFDTYRIVDESDKKWLLDKGMFEFYRIVEEWEAEIKHISYSSILRVIKRNISSSINIQNNNNKSKQNPTFEKKKKKSTADISTDMRKSHMPLHYKKATLIEHIKSNLEQINPSNIDVNNISSLFLPKIWDTINESIKKDINELFRAYYYELWTATSVMAYRIFENVLKVHIAHDLKEEPAIDITDAIKKLEKNKYDPYLLKILYELKEHRNSFMHGNTRASTQEAKESIVKVMSLAMNIHNIRP